MIPTQKNEVALPPVDSVDDASSNVFHPDQIAELRRLVERLPLDSEAYQLISRCLNNSQKYANTGLMGAARFELRQVVSHLKKSFDLKALLKRWIHEKNRSRS